MTKLPYSNEQQIELLLERKLFAEIDKLFPDMPNPRKLITITKSDVLTYLRSHPGKAIKFFTETGSGASCPNWHDVPAMWKEADSYKVAWLDHGKPIDSSSYLEIEDAVAMYLAFRYLGG